ncbi:MAG TPA: MerR family transcriptional regulator [Thermomicrobiales bacterium]|nr:MerR family transcriptional regulator [Thermomicrobiales bacterium]
MSTERLRIGDFADAAGVSPRTVRYYVVEGLLPPPEGAGMGASYGPEHLDRLRLILRLKDAYLPLREIRRQLTGLSDEEVRQRLREMDRTEALARGRAGATTTGEQSRARTRGSGSARDYLRGIGEDRSATSPDDLPATPPGVPVPEALPDAPIHRGRMGTAPAREEITAPEPAPDPDAPSYPGYVVPGVPLRLGRAIPAAAPPEPPTDASAVDPDREPTAEHWVRLKLGDDAELLIRSGAYHRLRDKVDWLVGWARAIFR